MLGITILLVTSSLLATESLGGPIQSPNEKIFSYYAESFVHNFVSEKYRSQWDIHGKLIVQTFEGYKIIKLDDLKIKVYNGHNLGKDEIHLMDIPKEAAIISEPFIYYSNNTIAVYSHEPLWSLNMKRSLASILYIDETKISEPKTIVLEKNMYGDCNIVYKATTDESINKFRVDKLIDISQCGEEISLKWSENKQTKCSGYQHTKTHRAISRTYFFEDKKDVNKIDRIEAKNEIMFQTSPNDLHVQKVQQFQSLDLIYSGDLKKTIDVSKVTKHKGIKYEIGTTPMDGRDVDAGLSTDKLVAKLMSQINIMTEELNKKTIDNTGIMSDTLDTIWYRLYEQTYESLVESMEKIKFDKEKKDLFLSVLPYIGTNDTIKFMIKLISSNEIENDQIIKMLAVFPKFVMNYSEDLLQNMQILMHLENKADAENTNLRNSGTLSYAALVHNTYKEGKINKEIFDEQVHKYVKLFKESKNYESRMIYLMSLQNMDVSLDTILPIIQDNNESPHIRALAIKIALPKFLTEGAKALEVFMPILKDTSLTLELRVLALTVLTECNISVDDFGQVYEYLKEETDDLDMQHLYHYLHASLASYKVDTKCVSMIKEKSIKYLPNFKGRTYENSWMTTNFRVGFTHKAADYGSTTHFQTVANPTSNTIDVVDITFDTMAFGIDQKISVHLKLQGISDQFINSIIKKKSLSDMFGILKKNNLVFDLPKLHVEFIVFIDDKVVYATHLNQKSFKNKTYKEFFAEIFLSLVKDTTTVRYPMMDYFIIPSDLGTDLSFNLDEEQIGFQSTDNFEIIMEMENLNYTIKQRSYTATSKTIQLFNPISNLRQETFNTVYLNMFGEITFNIVMEDDIYIQFDNENVMYEKGVELNQGIFVDNEIILHEYCPKCKSTDIYTESDKNKKVFKKINILDFPMSTHALNFFYEYTGVKGIEGKFKQILESAIHDNTVNNEVFPPSILCYVIHHAIMHEIYTPEWNTYHASLQFKPALKEPTKTVLTMYASSEDIINNTIPMPGSDTTLSFAATVLKIKDDAMLAKTNISLRIYEAPGLNNQTINFHVDFTKGNLHTKMCLNIDTRYPQLNPDFYSTKAADPFTGTISFKIAGGDKPVTSCSEDNVLSLEVDGIFSVTDEQKEIASKAEVSPFKECKEESNGFKYTVPTKSCQEAAKEMNKYRTYDMTLEIKAEKDVSKLSAFGQTFSNAIIGLSRAPRPVNISLEFPVSKSYGMFTYNIRGDKETSLLWPPVHSYPYIDESMLLTSRDYIMDMDEDVLELGETSTCLISNNFISTFSDKLIKNFKHDINTEMVALIECEKASEIVSFTKIDDKHVSVNILIDGVYVDAKPSEKGLHVTVNDEDLERDEVVQFKNIRIYHLADDVIYVKGTLMQVYYNMEYIRIEVYSPYNNRVCGFCGPHSNEIQIEH